MQSGKWVCLADDVMLQELANQMQQWPRWLYVAVQLATLPLLFAICTVYAVVKVHKVSMRRRETRRAATIALAALLCLAALAFVALLLALARDVGRLPAFQGDVAWEFVVFGACFYAAWRLFRCPTKVDDDDDEF